LHLSVVEDTKELVEVAKKIQMERREEQMKRDHLARMKVLAESPTVPLWEDTLPVIFAYQEYYPSVFFSDPDNVPHVKDHARTILLPLIIRPR